MRALRSLSRTQRRSAEGERASSRREIKPLNAGLEGNTRPGPPLCLERQSLLARPRDMASSPQTRHIHARARRWLDGPTRSPPQRLQPARRPPPSLLEDFSPIKDTARAVWLRVVLSWSETRRLYVLQEKKKRDVTAPGF
ncbi:hypothetical protein Y1Q_0007072 [Alligator mississippiensis]|uniref:Uncharacterized protein n=1 Tax=Alligator mississippiensis TaxID=8496 RepID=A0A151N5L6_ALLMI|nr:hypothetical protein Y1Q_0007072 [Alligator mississippiensis]